MQDIFILKPGGVFKEDWCTVCQCINNAYVCDDSSCQQTSSTEYIKTSTPQPLTSTTEFEEPTTSYKEIITEISTTSSPKYTSTPEEIIPTTKIQSSTADHLSTTKSSIISTTFSPEVTSTTQNIDTTTTEEIILVPSTLSPPIVFCDSHQ